MDGSRASDVEAPPSVEVRPTKASSDEARPSPATHAPEPGSGGLVTESFRLLRRNPELAKVILTVGLQMAAADVAGTIDLGPDTNQTWGARTSATVAWFEIAAAVVAYATGPLFGRFADAVDRRIVVVVYGLISFLPTFVYWFCFPLNSKVVWASHYASIAAAVGRSSNVHFALSTDVTAFEDRAMAAGIYYGMTNFLLLLLSVLPSFLTLMCNPFGLNDWLGNHQYVILLYQTGLVVAFLASACCIAKPKKQAAEDSCFNAPGDADATEDAGPCSCVSIWFDDLKLVRRHPRLIRLMLSAFFLSVSATLSTGNDGQFFAESLGLYRIEESLLFDQMNVLRSVGSSLIFTPAYLLAGYVAMSRGTLKVLRGLVPMTAVVMAVGGFVVLIPHMWVVPFIVAVQNMGDLYQVPLMRMAAGVARPGRVGTWLTLVGMAVEAGNVVGYFTIIIINSLLSKSKNHFPLWIYYPAAGAVGMLALISIWGQPKTDMGWGAAAGSCKDQFKSMMLARKLAKRWEARALGPHGANSKHVRNEDAGAAESTATTEEEADIESNSTAWDEHTDSVSSTDFIENHGGHGAQPQGC